MKKVIITLISIVLTTFVIVHAEVDYTIETNDTPTPGVTKIYDHYNVFDYNDKQYFFNSKTASSPKQYNAEEFDFFIKQLGATSYKHVDDCYMVVTNIPYSIVFAGGDSWKGYSTFYLDFYDFNFNLIKRHNMKCYINSYGYYNGAYYCSVISGSEGIKKYETSDKQNWDLSNLDVSKVPVEYDGLKYISNSKSNEVSFNGNEDFYKINYENPVLNQSFKDTDIGFFTKDSSIEDCYFFSTNNIYYLKISLSKLDVPKPELGLSKSTIQRWYFTNDSLILESDYGKRIKISKEELANELDNISNSPYVKYNNQILAFEQPPVIENDYTLVPIRFLFEQMGADVTWNQETQTATITQDNTAITFGIDDTNASVNGNNVSMDIPARLINDKTMVPVRFLSEELGYTVNWDGENRIITIE